MWLRAIALLILLVAQGDALEDYQILAQIKTYWNITAIWTEPCDNSSCPWQGVTWAGISPNKVTSLLITQGLNKPIPGALISQLTYVTELLLDYNAIPGPFPSELALLNLTVLGLTANQLSVGWAGIPIEYNSPTVWPTLGDLRLSDNNLNIPWPTVWLKPTLTNFEGNRDVFSGAFPTEFSAMPQLRSIFVDNGGTSWPFPSQLLNYTDTLYKLSFVNSGLTGTFDLGSGRVYTQLGEIRLAQNSLTGTLPDFPATTFPKLTEIYLSDNPGIKGTKFPALPPTLSALLIANIDLQGAQLPGAPFASLPFGQTYVLDAGINLSNCNLTGTIPPEIGLVAPAPAASGDFYIDLSGNRFSGLLPRQILRTRIDRPGAPGTLYLRGLTGLTNCTNPGACDWLCPSTDGLAGASKPSCPLWPARPVWDQPYCLAVCDVAPSPTTPPPTCTGPPPVASALCTAGVWFVPTSVTNSGTITVGNTPVVIDGSFTQGTGGVLQIVIAGAHTTSVTPLTVYGNVTNDGVIALVLDSPLAPDIYPVVVASGAFAVGRVEVTQTYSGCKRRVSTAQSADGLSLLMSIEKNDCGPNKSAIIIGVVVAVCVVGVVVAIVLILTLRPEFLFRKRVTNDMIIDDNGI